MAKKALMWALGLVMMGAVTAHAEDLVVVVNDKAPVQTLSADDIKAIYLGEQTFWGNVKITPVGYQEGTPLKTMFLDQVLNVSENAYKTYWIKRIFREGGIPPTKAGSPVDALRNVAQHPGGIAYVGVGDLKGASGVRVVFRPTP